MGVLYYPNVERQKMCRWYKELPAIVLRINKHRQLDLEVMCPNLGPFYLTKIARKTELDPVNVWDFNEEYEITNSNHDN